MKRLTVAWLSAFLLSGSALTSYAQTNSPIPERDSSSVSLFEYATKIPKRNKVFNLDLEMHAGFNADFFSGKLDEAAFRFRDVKIDVMNTPFATLRESGWGISRMSHKRSAYR